MMKLHAKNQKKLMTRFLVKVGTNDATDRNITADNIYDGLLELKALSEAAVPGIRVTISCPMVRTDNRFANDKLVEVKNRLIRSGLPIILNDNINEDHLGYKGLHLKQSGTNQLSENVGNFIRNLSSVIR